MPGAYLLANASSGASATSAFLQKTEPTRWFDPSPQDLQTLLGKAGAAIATEQMIPLIPLSTTGRMAAGIDAKPEHRRTPFVEKTPRSWPPKLTLGWTCCSSNWVSG
jgi:hypothetical protein